MERLSELATPLEISFLEELLEAGVELLGILIGHEMAAKHLGGRVRAKLVEPGNGDVCPMIGDVHEGGQVLIGILGFGAIVGEDGIAEELVAGGSGAASAEAHEVVVLRLGERALPHDVAQVLVPEAGGCLVVGEHLGAYGAELVGGALGPSGRIAI